MSKKILIVFWHGIGDFIISTPALKEFKEKHQKDQIYFATTNRIIKSNILKNCPYFSKVLKIENPWDSKDFKSGYKKLEKDVKKLEIKLKVDKVIVVNQSIFNGFHKLKRTYIELGLKPNLNTKYEIFLTKKNLQDAKSWLDKNKIGDFVFLHRLTEAPEKNLSKKLAYDFIKKKISKKIKIVEPNFSYKNKDINFSFAIQSFSKNQVLVDSVFLHSSSALKKNIDFAYFNFRPLVYKLVEPIGVDMNIVKGPNEKKVFQIIKWEYIKLISNLLAFYKTQTKINKKN